MLSKANPPCTKTETHVRDLFTQRYTLMFTQDKGRRGKFPKLNSLKQIGCEAIFAPSSKKGDNRGEAMKNFI